MPIHPNSQDEPLIISSLQNPKIKQIQTLAKDNTAYRKLNQLWLEGDRLCHAYLERGLPILEVGARKGTLFPDHPRLKNIPTWYAEDLAWGKINALATPSNWGLLIPWEPTDTVLSTAPTVILDGVQDAGNAGTVIRTAAAFGFKQVIALSGTVALWSPKVLRAAMGAHFSLHLAEGIEDHLVEKLNLPLLMTSSHQGEYLHQLKLPWPCAWIFGNEGQGVRSIWKNKASTLVQIAQPGGQESLNVALAAAICLHATATTKT